MARRKDGTRRGSLPLRIVPNKNRRLQMAPTRRKLFDEAAKDDFLEWFAATCNCSLSARKAGFHYRTVIRHWREDEAFAGRCEAALQMGYNRLEELALRAAEEALKRAAGEPVAGDRAPPPEHFAMDPMTALNLLREHKRHLAGLAGGSGRGATSRDRRSPAGASPRRWRSSKRGSLCSGSGSRRTAIGTRGRTTRTPRRGAPAALGWRG
jgi:hypothetical protein